MNQQKFIREVQQHRELNLTKIPTQGYYLKDSDTIGLAGGGAEIAAFASKAFSMGGQSAKIYFGSSTLADHEGVALPTYTVFMFGIILGKAGATFTLFYATPAGAVTLVSETSDVVANATTDAKLDVGVATANPIVLTNELGGTYDFNYVVWYY